MNLFPHCRAPQWQRLIRIIGLAALCLALQGCSMVKLAYNSLPELAYFWIDGYADLDDTQSASVREDLQRLHQWHRSTELPRLAGVLQQAQRLAAEPMSAEQACAMVSTLRERLQAVFEQAEPSVLGLVTRLKPAQLRHLEAKYQRNNQDYRKDWLSLPPAEQKDKFAKTLIERAEMIYGRLDDGQRQSLRRLLDRTAWDPAMSLRERVRRQQDTLATLRAIQADRPAPAELRQRMRALLERSMESPDISTRAWQQALMLETCRGLAEVHASASAEQRAAAVRRLKAWQQDALDLSLPVISGGSAGQR